MSNIQRQRWDLMANPASQKTFTCLDTDTIEVGDLMWMQKGTPSDPTTAKVVRPASATALWTGTLAGTQGKLAENFVGVAVSAKYANDGNVKVQVAGRGTFGYPCPSATYEIGDLVGGSRDGGSNFLKDQEVVKIAQGAVLGALTESMAIGKVNKQYVAATTLVEFEICGRAEAAGGVRAFLSS